MIQPKLVIDQPGDIYEQEADRIADQVMATPAHPASSAPPRIQRLAGSSAGQVDSAPASVDQTLASPGMPLEPVLRQDMEQRFGHDFSRVRVHSGAAAEQSARDVSAQAYTVGHDIVFGVGRFEPSTHQGKWLIVHELTHVMQQQSQQLTQPMIQRQAAAAVAMEAEPKVEPSMLGVGKICHTAIGEAYAAMNPPTITDEKFISIIQMIGFLDSLMNKGIPSPQQAACYTLRPDVYDVGKQQVYEIKSSKEVPRALAEAVLYMNCFNMLKLPGLSVSLGNPMNRGTSGFIPAGSGWCVYTCPAPGALIYEYILLPENPRSALERLKAELQGGPELGVETATALATVGALAPEAIAGIKAAKTYAELIAALVRHVTAIRLGGAL